MIVIRLMIYLWIIAIICHGYNILFITQFGTRSHVTALTPAVEALSTRGHNITYLTFHAPTFLNPHTSDNVTVVLMNDVKYFLETHQDNVFNSSYTNVFSFTRMMHTIFVDTCDIFLQDPGFKRLAEWKATYDVIIMDPVASECALTLVWLLGSPPLMFYAPTGLLSWIAVSLDIPTPFAYIPMITMRFSDFMTFTERFTNTFQNLVFWISRNYVIAPILENRIRKIYPSMPSLLDIGRNASFAFSNSHSQSIDFPRPWAPYYEEVGGVHCRPGRRLPKDLEEFVCGSGEEGFIYFSFGSYIRGVDMPPKMLDSFLAAFRRIKQRVLWKFDINVTDLPSNVRLINWAPQQDLLGHPKIRLFMTHYGQLSIQESVYHRVPMVGMPFCNDQFSNMRIATENGMGESLDYMKYDEHKIYNALSKVLNNPSYKENIIRYSVFLRDRPMKAIDTIVYWVEYVARHRGALHLRFKSKQLPLYQQLLLDIIVNTLIFVIFMGIAITFIIKTVKNKFGSLQQLNLPNTRDNNHRSNNSSPKEYVNDLSKLIAIDI